MPDKNVQLPDGRVVAFPDSMADADISAVIKKQLAPPQDALSRTLANQTAAQSGQPMPNPADQPGFEAGKKAGMKAASETVGAVAGGGLAPEAAGLGNALLRILGVSGGAGAGNVAGQLGTTGTVNPKETAKTVGATAALSGLVEGAAALPSAAKAGKALQEIKQTAGDVPIDMSRPGNTALELYEQSQRGASLPKVVRDFVKRATAPGGEPITYAEAKDFQSNVSQLSADERMMLKPNTKRLLGQLNSDLKSSLEDAADVQGKGEQFTQAMKEYHHAMQLRDLTDTAKEALWKAVLTGAGLYGVKKILESTLP